MKVIKGLFWASAGFALFFFLFGLFISDPIEETKFFIAGFIHVAVLFLLVAANEIIMAIQSLKYLGHQTRKNVIPDKQ